MSKYVQYMNVKKTYINNSKQGSLQNILAAYTYSKSGMGCLCAAETPTFLASKTCSTHNNDTVVLAGVGVGGVGQNKRT